MKKKKKIEYILCPKCYQIAKPDKHHVHTKAFYPKSNVVLYLCYECHHNDLHKKLPMEKKRPEEFYERFIKAWLKTDDMVVKLS